MASPSYARSPFGMLKRIKISSPVCRASQRAPLGTLDIHRSNGVDVETLAEERGITLPPLNEPLDAETEAQLAALRSPQNLQAIHLKPLRRAAKFGVPVCDLQLRTYSIRNMEFFADFAMRAAYYLNLPAKGPIPLPRITERWTVPRSNFIFKKSQENFERITMRRLIQIQDGHPETVRIWLGFLQKHAYYGVGMKANVWEWEGLDAAKNMDKNLESAKADLDERWKGIGRRVDQTTVKKVEEMLNSEPFKQTIRADPLGTKVWSS